MKFLKLTISLGILSAMSVIYTIASSIIASSDTSSIPVESITIEHKLDEYVKEELMCLSKNIYFEAGTESDAGKIAVGLVTMNRVADKRWPNTVCEVVQQGPINRWWWEEKGKKVPIKHRCQFSWYCDGKGDDPYPGSRWDRSVQIAEQIYFTTQYQGLVEGATHYHATYVNPSWAQHLTTVTRIDTHIFYK